jgi:beta-lactamase regulating signal transducer with metallopeptidase domain
MNTFIETLNRTSEGLPHLAWQMFWQSSLIIAVVFALDLALRRKARAAVRYALWLVVLIKLLLPPTLALPTGIAWWLRPGERLPAVVQAKEVVITYPDNVIPFHRPIISATLVPPAPRLSVQAWIFVFASAISAALLAWLLTRWIQISRTVRQATEPGDSIPAVLEDARRTISINSHVCVRITKEKMSPAVCGLFRPVILLPESLVENLPGSQMRAVLIHELVHLKRGDVWVNCPQALVQIIYWWHPLVWFANARIRRVREEAVDDDVMLALRDEADCYAPTLLEVAKHAFHRPLASLGLVGILESRGALRQRIERLIDFKTPRRAGLSIVSTLAIVAFTAAAVPMGEAPARSSSETKATQGTRSGSDTNSSLPRIMTDPQFKTVLTELQQREQLSQLIQDARLLFELGKYDEAERRLNGVLKVDPKSAAANYYLTLVRRSRDQEKTSGSGNLVNDLVYRTTNQQAHAAKPIQVAQNSVSPANQPASVAAPSSPLDGVLAFDKELKEATVNAGEAEAKFKFNLTNVSSFAVTITNILTSCGCTIAKMPASPWLLAPGAAGEIPVTMNIAGKSGVLTKTVSVNSDKGTKVLTVKATIRSPEEIASSDTQQTRGVIGSSAHDQSKALIDTLISRGFKLDVNAFLKNIERSGSSTNGSGPNGNQPITMIKSFFKTQGIDLEPPKNLFLVDRQGSMWVRATKEDLDIIEGAIQTFSIATPQVVIQARFFEMPKEIADTLGISWSPTNNSNGLIGVLAAPQLKEVLKQLDSANGVMKIFDGSVVTLSGRQAQIQAVEMKTLGLPNPQNGVLTTNTVPIGSVLDVIPFVGVDGYTIQMTLIPSYTEFLGYDSTQPAIPRIRTRQMTTSAIVWDGQTLVLGSMHQNILVTSNGAISTNQIPEDSQRNLLVLVTPTLIDPAGNRVHVDEDLNEDLNSPPRTNR